MYQPYRFREPHWGYQYEKHLRELLRIDFPELLPVYVISILAAGKKFWRDGTKAYTGPFLDLYLREFWHHPAAGGGVGFVLWFKV